MGKRRPLYAFLLLFIACSSFYGSAVRAQNQSRTIDGTVTAPDGKPVPYASVQVKGTNTVVVTDEKGHFSLSVGKGSVLLISAASFESQEVSIQGLGSVAITLKDRFCQPELGFLDGNPEIRVSRPGRGESACGSDQ
jgi:uncharacterized membrane protein